MKKYSLLIVCMLSMLCLQSCSSTRKAVPAQPQIYTMNLALIDQPMANKYVNMDYGIRLNVQDTRADKRLIQMYDASATSTPRVNVNPTISSFTSESVRRYMRTMGFNLDADVATDYMMELLVDEFHVDYLSGIGWQGTVIMHISIYDHNRTLVYPNTEIVGRASINASAQSFQAANQILNKAYATALQDIDWDRVAYFLHRSSSPKQEPNKQVKGEGNTSLEHMVVHWNINSRPQGADIYWRVISKTSEVKNQNYKYLETTPYEGSETLDIKGLTYNNAGLVQIEVKCEKNGYYTQTKKFDVLSLIDDNDVSTMFKLVNEDYR